MQKKKKIFDFWNPRSSSVFTAGSLKNQALKAEQWLRRTRFDHFVKQKHIVGITIIKTAWIDSNVRRTRDIPHRVLVKSVFWWESCDRGTVHRSYHNMGTPGKPFGFSVYGVSTSVLLVSKYQPIILLIFLPKNSERNIRWYLITFHLLNLLISVY